MIKVRPCNLCNFLVNILVFCFTYVGLFLCNICGFLVFTMQVFFFTICCVVFVLSLQVFNVKYFFFLVLVFGVTCVGILLPWGFCYMCGFLLYLCGFLLYLWGFCYTCRFFVICVGFVLPV